MTKDQMEEIVRTLAKKASEAENALDALQFSQAATNTANAFCALGAAKRDSTE